jgi:hypothetical protein
MDVAIVIDASEALCVLKWAQQTAFVKSVVAGLGNVGESGTNVAFIIYATSSKVVQKLVGSDVTLANAAIEDRSHVGVLGNLHLGVDDAKALLAEGRPGVPKLMIIVSAAQPTNVALFSAAISQIRATGVVTMGVLELESGIQLAAMAPHLCVAPIQVPFFVQLPDYVASTDATFCQISKTFRTSAPVMTSTPSVSTWAPTGVPSGVPSRTSTRART